MSLKRMSKRIQTDRQIKAAHQGSSEIDVGGRVSKTSLITTIVVRSMCVFFMGSIQASTFSFTNLGVLNFKFFYSKIAFTLINMRTGTVKARVRKYRCSGKI